MKILVRSHSLVFASVSSSSSCPVYCGSSSCQANAAASRTPGSEHRGIAQHIWDDDESDVAASDVDLVKMRHSAVTCGCCDIFKLDVHVVFGCWSKSVSRLLKPDNCAGPGRFACRPGRTVPYLQVIFHDILDRK